MSSNVAPGPFIFAVRPSSIEAGMRLRRSSSQFGAWHTYSLHVGSRVQPYPPSASGTGRSSRDRLSPRYGACLSASQSSFTNETPA